MKASVLAVSLGFLATFGDAATYPRGWAGGRWKGNHRFNHTRISNGTHGHGRTTILSSSILPTTTPGDQFVISPLPVVTTSAEPTTTVTITSTIEATTTVTRSRSDASQVAEVTLSKGGNNGSQCPSAVTVTLPASTITVASSVSTVFVTVTPAGGAGQPSSTTARDPANGVESASISSKGPTQTDTPGDNGDDDDCDEDDEDDDYDDAKPAVTSSAKPAITSSAKPAVTSSPVSSASQAPATVSLTSSTPTNPTPTPTPSGTDDEDQCYADEE